MECFPWGVGPSVFLPSEERPLRAVVHFKYSLLPGRVPWRSHSAGSSRMPFLSAQFPQVLEFQGRKGPCRPERRSCGPRAHTKEAASGPQGARLQKRHWASTSSESETLRHLIQGWQLRCLLRLGLHSLFPSALRFRRWDADALWWPLASTEKALKPTGTGCLTCASSVTRHSTVQLSPLALQLPEGLCFSTSTFVPEFWTLTSVIFGKYLLFTFVATHTWKCWGVTLGVGGPGSSWYTL